MPELEFVRRRFLRQKILQLVDDHQKGQGHNPDVDGNREAHDEDESVRNQIADHRK